ncbi:MAG: hypothetical protein SF182_02280 [Deltaproteobacteria bacterium]|nr:hypothetical protein [Deltaproteobacteria bacterium]
MPTDESLSERVIRLERAQRRLHLLVTTLGLLLLATVVLGATGAGDGVLRGRSLQLTDDQERVRVLLSATAGVSLLGPDGAPRAVLSLDGSGPGLVLYGSDSRAILNINPDGPALAFTAARGGLRAILASVRGAPGLVFFDAEERERLHLAVGADGARAALRGADGAVLWQQPPQ